MNILGSRSSKTDKFSRRALLKGLGVGAGMLPLLSTERAPAAAATGFPKRLITIAWTNGIVPVGLWPAGGAGPLAAPLPTILSPLQPWASSILVSKGSGQNSPFDVSTMVATNRYGGHSAYPALLTGFKTGGGPSVDTIVANALAAGGVAGKQLNVGCRPGSSSTTWRAAGQKNTAETDPYRLFTRLFAGASMPPAQMNTLLLRRQSVLDFVGKELTAFGANMGTEDKAKVQEHLDSIRALEMQLSSGGGTGGAGCAAPAPLAPAGLNFKTVTNYPNHVAFMMGIVGAAVKCDMARAVTMDLIDDGGGNSLTFPWLNIPTPDYHTIAHQDQAGYPTKTQIDQWFFTQVAILVKALADSPEGTGSALDNTAIVIINDMSFSHDIEGVPYLVIGGCGGFFKTGRIVTLPNHTPNNYMLTTLCHAMDVDVASVGDAAYVGNVDTALTT